MSACATCGEAQADARARFCENCGASLVGGQGRIAGDPMSGGCRCATPQPDEDGFCGTCGKRAVSKIRAADLEEWLDAATAMACDRGRRHPNNQDAGGVAGRGDGTILLVVADGVSTASRSDEAALAAVAASKAAFFASRSDRAATARGCLARAAAVVAAMRGKDEDDGPASTLVLAVVAGHEVALAWAGDSRAYQVMAGVPATQLTRDDSWCMDEVEAKRLTYAEALATENAHAITQWLGMAEGELRIHVKEFTLPPGAALLLCSDGLWNYADDGKAMGAAYSHACRDADAAETCRRLVAFANDKGGRDNITVALRRP